MKPSEKFLPILKNVSRYIFNNIEILIVAFLIFLSPFIVDYTSLPKGFELPKVTFLQIGIVILTFIFINKEIFSSINPNQKEPKKISRDSYKFRNMLIWLKASYEKLDKGIIFLILGLALIALTTLLSPYREIAIYGNSFRFQGAITHVLLVILAFVVYKKGDKNNLKWIIWAFFLSALFQAAQSTTQLIYFIENNPKVIFEGYYINGTFGQANFYSGRITLGIMAGIFIISSQTFTRVKANFLKRLVCYLVVFSMTLAVLFLIFGLVISFSTWGIITSAIMVFTLIVYEITRNINVAKSKNIFGYIFGIALIVGIIAGGLLLRNAYLGPYNIRLDIWQQIVNLSIQDSPLRVMLGYGYDTLGEVFRGFGVFVNNYVDRAHNFLLDVYSQNGLSMLILFAGILIISILKFIFLKSSRTLTYLFVGLILWQFRSFIHESGIVNLADFIVLFGGVLALQKDIRLRFPKLRA